MARDLGEQERAFVEALASDTGRDLAAWMTAIAESGHAARNDIIDWLRHQGFNFSNASWLERIHHNGGRLIYAANETRTIIIERPAPVPAPAQQAAVQLPAAPSITAPPPAITPQVAPEPQRIPEPPSPTTPELQPQAASEAEIAALLMAAKGLRPLAGVILREMDAIVPALVQVAAAPFITLASPMPFAALLPGPKDVRLFADFGPNSRDRTRKSETARFTTPFPDVIVLSDARQLDDRFRELVATAYTRALK